jgi:5'-phosphate synthase pdxT subunit
VNVLASRDGFPVLVRQNNILAATFHPELSHANSSSADDSPADLDRNPDRRVHAYFAQMVRDASQAAGTSKSAPEPATVQSAVANRE